MQQFPIPAGFHPPHKGPIKPGLTTLSSEFLGVKTMSLKLNSKPFVPCSLGEVPVVETWLKKDATILVLAPITSRIDYFVALFPLAYS